MNRKNINVRNLLTFAAAALVFAGCASTEAEGDHLEEGDVGVVTERATWGMGGIGVPAKFTVKPGDSVERMTRSCGFVEPDSERITPASECRKPLDTECNDDGGIPLPETSFRPVMCEDEPGVCGITVTIKCRFPANDES